ncbi:MAG: c-type cytochrome, partial [Ferruginibacter sp.]
LVVNKLVRTIILLIIALFAMVVLFYFYNRPGTSIANNTGAKSDTTVYWKAVDINSISDTTLKQQVQYGKELIVHTAKYFGPKGIVIKSTNGLNCQNCHPQAGTAIFGNNFGSVASMYPKFKARSGTKENLAKKVNDCFERSLNGKTIDTTGKEMQAMLAYINFIGSNVIKGTKAVGSGPKDLPYLDRAADSTNGSIVFNTKCKSCHQYNGQGLLNADSTEFIYPALWGKNSFNDAAGIIHISLFAKFVKNNMPVGTTYAKPQLTDEEAWDVAAFIISQPRPHMATPKDWPDIKTKPIDHPIGPYADTFSVSQHKYGPFKMIAALNLNNKK